MRLSILFALAFSLTAAAASAQTSAARPPAAPDQPYYAELVAHSAFGNVTSQSYGAEFGANWRPNIDVFVEIGHVRDASTTALSSGALEIAGALTSLQPAAVSYTEKQPVTFGGAGLRYRIQTEGRVHPYVLGGGGVARVNNNVNFQLGGVDAGSSLSQYVSLGSDLSGSMTKPMLTLGAGVVVPVHGNIVVDLQYRFGRIFAGDSSIDMNRVGLGLGLRF
jgi:opacity protein-like surface antigen